MTITQAKIVIPLKNSSFERSRVEDDVPLEEAASACLIKSMSKYFNMHTHAPNSKALSDVKSSKVKWLSVNYLQYPIFFKIIIHV